jgi:hypothetical protein
VAKGVSDTRSISARARRFRHARSSLRRERSTANRRSTISRDSRGRAFTMARRPWRPSFVWARTS